MGMAYIMNMRERIAYWLLVGKPEKKKTKTHAGG
jgi:hypothetical protein